MLFVFSRPVIDDQTGQFLQLSAYFKDSLSLGIFFSNFQIFSFNIIYLNKRFLHSLVPLQLKCEIRDLKCSNFLCKYFSTIINILRFQNAFKSQQRQFYASTRISHLNKFKSVVIELANNPFQIYRYIIIKENLIITPCNFFSLFQLEDNQVNATNSNNNNNYMLFSSKFLHLFIYKYIESIQIMSSCNNFQGCHLLLSQSETRLVHSYNGRSPKSKFLYCHRG